MITMMREMIRPDRLLATTKTTVKWTVLVALLWVAAPQIGVASERLEYSKGLSPKDLILRFEKFKNDKNRWRDETNEFFVSSKESDLKLQISYYLLLEPAYWKVEHSRDSEGRATVEAMSGEVGYVVSQALKSPVDYEKLAKSQNYRNQLAGSIPSHLVAGLPVRAEFPVEEKEEPLPQKPIKIVRLGKKTDEAKHEPNK